MENTQNVQELQKSVVELKQRNAELLFLCDRYLDRLQELQSLSAKTVVKRALKRKIGESKHRVGLKLNKFPLLKRLLKFTLKPLLSLGHKLSHRLAS